MPFLSVIVPSMRCGGVNILLDSLAAQQYTDFELVFVDALHSHRAEAVKRAAWERFLRVVHVAPEPNQFPLAAYCASVNAGLVHASGEVIVLLTDYTRLPPDCLAKHAAFHQANDGGLMMPHRYVALEMNKAFPVYGRDEADRYAADVKRGWLDPYMLSIGTATDRPADSFEVDGKTIATADADPKLRMSAGPIEPSYFHCKNESVRLSKLLDVGGFDTRLDGSHGWQDTDIAERLAKAGVRFTLDPSCVAEIANPRGVFPFAKRERPFPDNERVWHESRAKGYPALDTKLKERRERRCAVIDAKPGDLPTTYTFIHRDAVKDATQEIARRMAQDTTAPVPVEYVRTTPSLARPLRIGMIYGEFSSAIHGPFDIDGLYTKTGLTGSESSFFNLARTLAERGHEIVVFCVTDKPAEHESGFVAVPIQTLTELHKIPQLDAVIAWNEPDYLRFAPSGVLRICDQQLNDWGYCQQAPQANVDLFVFPSESSKRNHAQWIQGGSIIPNSVDLDLFGPPIQRNPHRVVYSSSPDRGLHHLLGIWPAVRTKVPDAELKIFYRLEPWLARARDNDDEVGRRARYIEAALPRLKDHGVVVAGPVPNAQMARELQAAAVLAYPCHPVRYTEGFGCSVLDAAAGGCLSLISDADALPEVHGKAAGIINGRPSDVREIWIDRIVWALTAYQGSPDQARCDAAMKAHAAAHSREVVTAQWERVIGEQLKARRIDVNSERFKAAVAEVKAVGEARAREEWSAR